MCFTFGPVPKRIGKVFIVTNFLQGSFPSQHVQSMPRGNPLPVISKLNICPCHVKWGNCVSCSIIVHPHEKVIVADVVKECCWVAVGHGGFVDLFIWCQSHHIAYVVPGHVDLKLLNKKIKIYLCPFNRHCGWVEAQFYAPHSRLTQTE